MPINPGLLMFIYSLLVVASFFLFVFYLRYVNRLFPTSKHPVYFTSAGATILAIIVGAFACNKQTAADPVAVSHATAQPRTTTVPPAISRIVPGLEKTTFFSKTALQMGFRQRTQIKKTATTVTYKLSRNLPKFAGSNDFVYYEYTYEIEQIDPTTIILTLHDQFPDPLVVRVNSQTKSAIYQGMELVDNPGLNISVGEQSRLNIAFQIYDDLTNPGVERMEYTNHMSPDYGWWNCCTSNAWAISTTSDRAVGQLTAEVDRFIRNNPLCSRLYGVSKTCVTGDFFCFAMQTIECPCVNSISFTDWFRLYTYQPMLKSSYLKV